MSLSDKEKFNLIKPLPEGWPKDEKGVPFLKRDIALDKIDWNNVKYTSHSNIKSVKDKENTIILNYQYDKSINCIYNDIFNYALKVHNFLAITTPDYSAYMNMEPWKIEENVSHNLWVGVWLQYLNLMVIPTITWANERTYDICFNHIEKGSVVTISTIGVSNCQKEFLKGFNEMMKRIEPSLVLIKGKPIKGMFGNLLFIDFNETFSNKNEYVQLHLFELVRTQKIKKDGDNYGW